MVLRGAVLKVAQANAVPNLREIQGVVVFIMRCFDIFV